MLVGSDETKAPPKKKQTCSGRKATPSATINTPVSGSSGRRRSTSSLKPIGPLLVQGGLVERGLAALLAIDDLEEQLVPPAGLIARIGEHRQRDDGLAGLDQLHISRA